MCDRSDAYEKAEYCRQPALEPSTARVGIVTCGGLCPGINDVVRSVVLTLHHTHGVREIIGFRYGLEGLTAHGYEPLPLMIEHVRDAHRVGGSFLGSSRGKQSSAEIVDTLERMRVHALVLAGGNGTIRAARDIHVEIVRRVGRTSVIVVPKTIDDDIACIDKTFGFDTAVAHARDVIDAAHVEARGARNGVGLVKLMGRDAGFVAAIATLASGEANFCLLPEFPYPLEGDDGLLCALQSRLERRGYAVVVVAEGCGIVLAREGSERDASDNLRYASPGLDIGAHLRDVLKARLKGAAVKYMDPSYTIRAARANATDAAYAVQLGRHAAHAVMAGKTDVLVGRVHGTFVTIPLVEVVGKERRVDDELWSMVRETTGQ